MILRPVRPASPWGPPMTKLPVGLMKNLVFLSIILAGRTFLATCLIRSALILAWLTPSSCWLDMTMASIRLGIPYSYSTVTWLLPSGRRCGCNLLAHLGHRALGQLVGQRDGQGHQLRRLRWRRSRKHHALVAGLPSAVHAHGDVRALGAQGHHHGAGLVVEAHGRVGVADFLDRLADDVGHVDLNVSRIGDFAGDDDHTGGGGGFAGHARARVLGQDSVQDGVRDVVTHFVGVALGDGLRGEEGLTLHAGSKIEGRCPRGGPA